MGGESSSDEAQKTAKVGYEAMRIGVANPTSSSVAAACQRGRACDDDHIVGSGPRYCQDLWMRWFQAASPWWSAEVVSGSTSLPLSKVAPSRTSLTRWGALTARHFDCAASISL